MSDSEDNIEALCNDLEDQYLSVGTETLSRRDSETSDTSQVSSLAGNRRRSRGGRMSQSEGGERRSKKKRVYPKVRTGCDTCKQRKIKCDEAKPRCRNCEKSQRQCLGYHPPQAKMFEPSQNRRPLDPASEKRLFAYFESHVAVKLARYRPLQLDLSFWQHIVPLQAADYPAVRHAMLLLAVTVEKVEERYSNPKMQDVAESDPYFALEQQYEVIKELVPAISALLSGGSAATLSHSATLICCLLLTLCDLWHLGIPLSFEHVFGGLDICNIVKKVSPSKSPQSETAEIDGTVMIPAYRYFADCAIVGLNNTNHSLLLDQFAERLDPIIPAVVTSIEEAYAVMDKVLRQIAKLEPNSSSPTTVELKSYLSTLMFTFRDSLDSAQSDGTADFRMLRIHHRAACILLDATTEGSETAYDKHMNDFDFLVLKAEELLLFESSRAWFGMIPPLFLAATKCRSPTLRHRALNVLHQVNQVERLWTSCTAYQIAKEVIRIEEETAISYNSRIRLTSILFNPTANKIDLGYTMAHAGEISFATSTIPWSKDETEINTIHKPASFLMPDKILKVCGYSTLLLAFRRGSCHCKVNV